MNDRAEDNVPEVDLDTAEDAVRAPAVETLTREQWIARIEEACADEGYFEPIGARHHAYFHDDGPVLLVSFEPLERILARRGQMPFGHDVAVANGWSHLTLICEGETWFRDPAVWGYFDRLVDDSFFEDFDRVLFTGAAACGYAACAYSVCAPGSTVLAISPRATLDPDQAIWDHRNVQARRKDFRSRYGYAPDMTEGASRVYVIYDPLTPENAMHAALFRRPWVTHLPVRHFGDSVETAVELVGVYPELLQRAMDETLDTVSFAKIWRIRRRFAPYLKGILRKAEMSRRPRLALMVCRSVVKRMNSTKFRRRMVEIEAQLGKRAELAAPADQTAQ